MRLSIRFTPAEPLHLDDDRARIGLRPVYHPRLELSGQRVLIVEDDHLAATALTEAVTARGAKAVGPVATVEEALALLKAGEKLGAAILDVNQAGDKVFFVAHALRRHAVPIVFVIGYDDWIIPQEYENMPVLRKPADPEDLVCLLFERS